MEDKRTFGQKMDEFLMKDSTFILLVIGAAAAIFAGTYMYISFGTGAFNDISIVAMLRDGIDTGDYAAAAAFAAGFLIARILEGPPGRSDGYRRFPADRRRYRSAGSVPFHGMEAAVHQLLYRADYRSCHRSGDWRNRYAGS